MISEGDTVEKFGEPAEVIEGYSTKLRLRLNDGRTIWDYRARHELPETCRHCDQPATHRVEVNAPGNGDSYGACEVCARDAAGHYVSVEEVQA